MAYHLSEVVASRSRDEDAQGRMTAGYNILRGALAWFDSHEVEKKLEHLPQWVTMARDLTNGR